jgi:hypothetical protein
MKRYQVKSGPGVSVVLEVIAPEDDGFRVRITRRHDTWEEVEESSMTAELFETCLRTGYMKQIGDMETVQVA